MLAGLAAVVALAAVGVTLGVLASRPAPIIIRNTRIAVVDGPHANQHVSLDATFYLPAGQGRVPAILLAHGFGETKYAVAPEAEYLARSGFAVLTWTARGFGASTGQIALDAPDYEVADVRQLVSWLARQPRVLLDGPGDPRVGIAGASYGGGISLLAAGYDPRIDAVVAQSTWNNLATALFPNNAVGGTPAGGVFKKQWAGLLFTQGAVGFGSAAPGAGGTGHGHSPATGTPLCGRFLPQICSMYQQVATLGRATPQAIALLKRSSPATVDSRIHAPTLLIQGEHDSLFGLSQANANYQQIRRAGTPVDMVWFAGGHDGGDQQTSRMEALTAQWFHRWLSPGHPPRSAPTGLPGFEVSRSLGFDPATGQQSLAVATAAAYPGLAGLDHVTVRLSGPPQVVINPPGGSPASISVFPGLGQLGPAAGAGGLTFDMPGQSAAFTSAPLRAPLQVTGSPQVRIRVSGARQVTLFAKVYDVNQVGTALLPYQLVAPVRVSNATNGATVTIRLPAMDYAFAAGHRLRLVLTTTDFAYATPAAPATYRVWLAGPGLTLPIDPALTVGGSTVPWWTWAAPAAALAAAIVLLMAGRRRRTERLSPRVAEVPLEITGLTKRYRDGQLAVDDLSLRVERGQILGLLGPNGAGKTTTLRALMGLLHPDAGTITIFGREVSPGSPALSRLGSFVEGPGFLPHLSGRANLDLYWQSTGRPIGDARLADVLAVAGLGEAIDRRVRTYSRGMCQRLAIAQAMLGFPDLLVLDEPMNGLDPPQIHEMRDVLRDYVMDGRTVILSSHLLAEVELTCTHVVVMNQGRRVAAGPVQAIIGEGTALAIGTPEVARALSALETVEGIAGAEPAPGGILVHAGEVPTADVVAVLVRAGVPVERVGPGRRLEDAFLDLISSDGVTAPAPAAIRSPAGQGAAMDGGS